MDSLTAEPVNADKEASSRFCSAPVLTKAPVASVIAPACSASDALLDALLDSVSAEEPADSEDPAGAEAVDAGDPIEVTVPVAVAVEADREGVVCCVRGLGADPPHPPPPPPPPPPPEDPEDELELLLPLLLPPELPLELLLLFPVLLLGAGTGVS